MKHTVSTAIGTAAGIALFVGAVYAAESYGSLITNAISNTVDYVLLIPDVHVSWSTDQCVRVLNYAEGDTYSCENMPTKFNHVWVQ